MRNRSPLLFALLAICGCLLFAGAAHAQRSRGEVRIARLLESAQAYYDNLELEEAERALNEAIDVAERDRISSPTVAQVYIQRGILSFVRDRDSDAAVVDFTRALRIDDRAELDPLVSTPRLKELFDRAVEQARSSGGGRDRRDRRDDRYDRRDRRDDRFERREPPPPRDEVRHDAPRTARGNRPVTLKIEVTGRLNEQVYRVYAFYRSARVDSSRKLELLPKGRSAFVGQIPGRFVDGRNLSYYIVVEDRGGKRIGGIASARNPMVVQIKGGALGDLDEIPSGGGLDGGDGDDGERAFVTLSLSVGTGGGFITNLAQPVTSTGAQIRPGFAVTPFHSVLEVDFWAADWFAISAFARIQIVEFAHAEGGRLKFRVFDSGSSQLELRGGGGFGQVRHLVNLEGIFDTTLQGPYFYTLGLSYLYRFTKSVALAITPDFMHMIGTSPSLHFDFASGVRFSF